MQIWHDLQMGKKHITEVKITLIHKGHPGDLFAALRVRKNLTEIPRSISQESISAAVQLPHSPAH